MRDYYEILGVSPKAAHSEIKKAYRELASKYHPDKHRGNDLEELAKEKLIEINAAYEVLSDENRRADYDRERQIGARGSSSPRGAGQGGSASGDFGSNSLRSILRLAAVAFIAFLVVTRVRSFAAILIIAAVILAAWFLPRFLKRNRR